MQINCSEQHRHVCGAMRTKGRNKFTKGGVAISKSIKRKRKALGESVLDFPLEEARSGGHIGKEDPFVSREHSNKFSFSDGELFQKHEHKSSK